jgi:broad specificity phosphatase PhoE
MTRIYLIRHGETDWNRDGICMGQLDVPLNERGRRQAELTAERLVHERLDVIYSSDLSRAVETAKIIRERQPHHPEIIQRPDLRELNYGCWQGLRREELEERFPEAFSRGDPHRADPLDFKPQGGESLRELRERSIKAFHEILELHRGEAVAVVAHGGVIRHIINYVLQRGAPLLRDQEPEFVSFGFLVSNCGITHIAYEAEEEEWVLYTLNDTCHLQLSLMNVSVCK